MPNANRFVGKAAFVTGAASGIGRATAIAFAAKGARVAILDRSTDALQETAEKLWIALGEVFTIAGDVSNGAPEPRSQGRSELRSGRGRLKSQ